MMVALLLKTTDLAALGEAMAQAFGDSPELFDHDPVLLDLAAVRDANEAVDFDAVKRLLRGYRLNAVAVRGGNEEQMQAALAADLSPAPDAPAPAAKPAAAKQGGAPVVKEEDAVAPVAEKDPNQLELLPTEPPPPDAGGGGLSNDAAAPEGEAAAAEVPTAKPAHAPRPTLVVDRPLRSGQQVYARGSDLVVLGAVNFGAEVIADGHIHVYAPLRGRAVAGARGDASARIFCTSMQAQLLSIAGVYRTSDAPLPQGLTGKPVQVRLDGENLRIEALNLE